MARRVKVETRTVGQSFGVVGVVRDARTRRKLVETDEVRPYGHNHSAARDAERLAEERGWEILADEDT